VHVFVCKSTRRGGTYVFLRERTGLDRLPDALRDTLAPFEPVMDFDLVPGKRLARVQAHEVIAALERQGYYLQWPPADNDADRVTGAVRS